MEETAGRSFYVFAGWEGVSGVSNPTLTFEMATNLTNVIAHFAPNPFTDKLSVYLHMPANGKLLLKLIDINGRIVVQESVLASKGFTTHAIKQTQQLVRGMYYLVVDFEGQRYSFKVIKQK